VAGRSGVQCSALPGAGFARARGGRGHPRRSHQHVDALQQRRAELAADPDALNRNATILIAEDHLDSRDAMRALLEAFGFEVVVAVDGRQAVEFALHHHPDLILMDIMMPELDGFEATRRLRQHDATRRTPIIAVTAMEGAQRLALQAGANDYVRKPIDIRGLIAKVHDWLPKSGGDG
jgi:CheY-like chemotaxis protein